MWLLNVALRILWVATVGFVSLPHPIVLSDSSLDGSWKVGLAMAAHQHLPWGRSVIFTYGPLGFLNHPLILYGGQWLAALAVAIAFQLALPTVIALRLTARQARPWVWLLVGAAFCTLGVPGPDFPDLMGLLLAALMLVTAAETRASWRAPALGIGAAALLGFLALIKTVVMTLGPAMLLAFAVLVLLQRRWRLALATASAFPVALFLLWLAAGQPVGALGAYLRSAYEIATGYPAAMSVPGDERLAVAGAILVAAAVAALLPLSRGRDRSTLHLLWIVLPILGVEFKEGFVRQDIGHEEIFFSMAALLFTMLVAEAATAPRERRERAAVAGAAAAVAATAAVSVAAGLPALPVLTALPDTVSAYRQTWGLLTDRASRRELGDAVRSGQRAAYAVPPAIVGTLRSGTVDVLPWDVALVDAYGLTWDPRPVLQSYSAYTPYLDERDAEHFAGPSGPDHVLLVDEAIDGRYPVFEEPATFRTLLGSYTALAGATPPYVALARRASTPPPATQEGTACAALGSDIPVPQLPGRAVFARLHISLDRRGQLMSLLLKPSPAYIRFQLAGGDAAPTRPYRLVTATAADGVFVSGYVEDSRDLHDLFEGVVSKPIHTLRVSSPGPGEYRSTVCADFTSTPLTGGPAR